MSTEILQISSLAARWSNGDKLADDERSTLFSWVLRRIQSGGSMSDHEMILWVFLIIGTETVTFSNCKLLIRCSRAS